MARICSALATGGLVLLCAAQAAHAQSPFPLHGLYVEGTAGINFLGDVDADIDNFAQNGNLDHKLGPVLTGAVGYSLPQGPLNLRLEGEVALRGNELDEVNLADGTSRNADDDSYTASRSGMVNVFADLYVAPGIALSAGGGLGFANVVQNLEVRNNGFKVTLIDDETDTVLAYQGRVGGRYDLSPHSTITLAYTYFATGDAEIDGDGGIESRFSYESHAIHGGYAYRF